MCGGEELGVSACHFEEGDDVFCAPAEAVVLRCAGDGTLFFLVAVPSHGELVMEVDSESWNRLELRLARWIVVSL